MKKILIVEGNLKEENTNFSKAGIQTHTQSLKDSLAFLSNKLALDVVNPSSDQNIRHFNENLHTYDGLIWGGSSLNIYNDTPEIRKQIEFRKKKLIEIRKVFKNENDIDNHISFIKNEILITDKKIKMLELQNWLNQLN